MTNLIILAVVVIIAVAVVEALRGKETDSPKSKPAYQYKQKNFIMTRAERECFDLLTKAVGNSYYIFPQVHLASIVDGKVKGQNWNAAFRHINQKSVDYVLCDKEYISPKLAIELDDKTHEREERIARDIEVERVLANAGLPLLRIDNYRNLGTQELTDKINTLIKPVC